MVSLLRVDTDEKKQLLLDEIKILQMLDHPHIVRYFSCGEMKNATGKVFAIFMELLSGGTLTKRMQTPPAPTEAQLAQWISAIASALACIHGARMLHRDL